MSRRFARPDGPYEGGPWIDPATVLTSGAADTFGSWQDLATTGQVVRDVCGINLMVSVAIGASNTDTQMLLEVGLGNTGDAVDKTILTGFPLGGAQIWAQYHLPLFVPAGTRIAGRIQGSVVNDIADLQVMLEYGNRIPGFGGFSKGEGLNVDAATSGFSHGDLTDNAWDQVVASTSVFYRAVSFVAMISGGSATAADTSVDIGIGGSGAEQVLGTYWADTIATEIISSTFGPRWIDHPIPVGSRLALRKNGTVNLTGTIVGWR